MGIFSRNKNKEELVLILDINSSFIGGALFFMKESKNPKIIYSVKEEIKIEKELKSSNFLPFTIKALKIVVGKICLSGLGKPNRIFCTLSSPWYQSSTKLIKFTAKESFVFNNEFADDLIKKEINYITEKHKKEHANFKNKIIPIEMKTMNISLNGYQIENPYNQKAKSLDMSIFFSFTEEKLIKQINRVVEQHFHFESIKFSTFLVSSFTVARDMFINQDDFLLINIGGEVTDISMIKKTIIKDISSFPIGSHYIIRNLAKNLQCDIKEAQHLFSSYIDKHTSDSVNRRVEETIQKLKENWLKVFQESLNTLSHDISVPSTVFITVEEDMVQFFFELIKTEQLNQYTLTDSKFRIIFLDKDALHGIVIFADKKIKKNIELIIDSIYINRFLK